MRTTTAGPAAYRGGIDQTLHDLLLDGRKSLPHGLNGHPKAPPERVASLRKNIRQGLSCPFRQLVEVSTTDITDGVPLSEVLAPYHRMIAFLESYAAERYVAKERPVAVLTPRVQKEMGELSLAMLRQANSPESVEAMEAVIREANDLPPVVAELTRTVGLHVVRASQRPARRLTLESRS